MPEIYCLKKLSGSTQITKTKIEWIKMLRIKYLIIGFKGLFPLLSHAQDTSKRDLLIRSADSGSYATKLEDLVDASDVIIRGRYGALESMERDYGGETLENIMRKTGKTEEEAALHGIPIANHEIIVDEIIKGNGILFNARTLTVQMAESKDAYKVFEWLADFREGEHLFFLRHHADREVYSIRGNMFDMKKIDGSYYYRDSEKYVLVFGSEKSENLLNSIEDIVN